MLKECLAQQGINPTDRITERLHEKSRTQRLINVSGGNEVIKWDLEQKNQYLQRKL